MGNIIPTGDRSTGKLHLGYYVGSLKNRVIMQNKGDFDKMYVMIAGARALTGNLNSPNRVRESIIEVAFDYLSRGIDPNRVVTFVQSHVEQLTELIFYCMNLVTLSRLEGNSTVKVEIKQKEFGASLFVDFLAYPISQTADITFFNADIVPVGEDQLPVLEQTHEAVRIFNNYYSEILVEPKTVVPDNKTCFRLPRPDGKAKMSKSLGNYIYLSDSRKDVKSKVMSMLIDSDHIQIPNPGEVEGNIVFTYLDVLCVDNDFSEFFPDYKNLDELKDYYRHGGLGNVKIKKFLNSVLQKGLSPIREKRKYYEQSIPEIFDMLLKGSEDAREVGAETLKKIEAVIGINYFEDVELINKQQQKYK